MSLTPVTGFAITASTTGFEQAMRNMQQQAQDTTGKINGLLGKLGVGLSVAAFGAWIKGSIDAADETSKLAQKTGLLVRDVAGLQLAFRQAGTEDIFEQSLAKLSKAAADGNKGLQSLGISVQANDGTFKTSRQILGEVADKFASYRDGVEKTALAIEIFGRSGAELIPLLNGGGQALDEYDAIAKRLGLTLEEETAKSAEKFNDTVDLMGQGVAGVGRQIAAGLLPTLTTMAGNMLDSAGSADGLRKVVDALAVALKTLYTVGAIVVQVFQSVGTVLGGVMAAAVAAMKGDFEAASDIMKNMSDDVLDGLAQRVLSLEAVWRSSGNAAVEAMTAMNAAGKGAAPRVAKDSAGSKPKKEREQSVMPELTAELQQRKLAFQQQNALLEFSKSQELAYWREVINTTALGSKDKANIISKMAQLEVDIIRKAAKDKQDIQLLRAEGYKSETLAAIEEMQARADFERQQGLATDQEWLAQRSQFNAQRLEAEMAFLQQKLEIAKLDPESNLVLMEQLEQQKAELRRKYQADELMLQREKMAAQMADIKAMINSLEGSWANSIKGMLNGTMSLGQGVRSMFRAVADAVIGMIAQIAARWLAQQVMMLIFGKTVGTSAIAQKAAEAGAGGVASMAAAPFPLNLSAPLFGAAMSAAAMAFAPMASASGGYNVPFGTNPLTQLHQEEMVLPAHIANPLRDMLAGGGVQTSEPQPVQPVIHITAMDSRDVERALKKGGALHRALKELERTNYR